MLQVWLTYSLIFAAATVARAGQFSSESAIVKHAWSQIPPGWELHSLPSADHPINLKIGLKQSKIDDLISTLYKISDPLHEDYGKYLTRL